MNRYSLDGTDAKVDGYPVWKILDHNGTLICVFHGPKALAMACASITMLADNKEPSMADCHEVYEKYRKRS